MPQSNTHLRMSPMLRAAMVFLLTGGFFAHNLLKAEAARSGGEEVILETRPIDPRDIFFGNYAVLRYALEGEDLTDLASIETKNALAAKIDESRNQTAYLALVRDGNFHEPRALTLDRAAAAAIGVPIKIRIRVSRPRSCLEKDKIAGQCDLRLSMLRQLPARYYADEQTAQALEDKVRVASRLRAAQRTYERCEARRKKALENSAGDPPKPCEKPEEIRDDQRFGVILSVTDEGEAVIRGLMIGDRRVLDSLRGSRFTMQ